jgi:uncharacterized protein (TIGR02099 family)
MVVRNALIVWLDEQRDAPPLVLENLNLRIESFFRHHRFALRAVPPNELSTPLDVRGDFYGTSFDNLNEWRGEIFTQLDYTDVSAWRPWLDMPAEFSRGHGALRGWLGVEHGKVAQITTDLDLHGVVTRLGKEVPEMALRSLYGRATWKELAGGIEISARRLAMRLQNGIELQPTDFYFRNVAAVDGHPASGEIRANLLQLETLASLANFLPLKADMRTRLDAYAPRGRVANLNAQWQGAPEKPDSYKIRGQFENLALRQFGKMPGFSGLSVDVDGSDANGRLNINSSQLIVDAPDVMREPLFFATLTGQAGWQRKHGELSIKVDNIAVVNDDLAGNLYGSYQTQANTKGVLDFTASLTRGDIRRAARYTPLVALERKGNDWLNGALQAGHTQDLRIRIKGNLSDFPPGSNKNVLFEIGGNAQGVVLEFDKNWPRIENISGELLIHGNKLEVKSPSATILDARLQNVTVTIPDMMSADLPLEIKGNAAGASNTFLQFIQQSPVRGYIDGFTDGMSASGDGYLDLFAHIPLLGSKPVKVSGSFRTLNNDIELGRGAPLLRKTRGTLSFTESGMQASDVLAEILGGPASLNVQTAEGGAVHATVKGRSNLDVLRKLNPHPLLNYLSGGAAWDADIRVVKNSAELLIKSDLRGMASTFPQPFAKRASDALPLRVEKKNVTDGQDVLSAELGKLLDARLVRREENGVSVIKRGVVNFGGQSKWPDKDGLWLTGRLPVLSLQGWEGLSFGGTETSPEMPLAGANLFVEKLTGYGQSMDGVRIEARPRGDGLAAQVSSSGLNGEIVWQPHGFNNGGKVTARLRNMQWSQDEPASQPVLPAKSGKPVALAKTEKVDVPKPQPGNLPALEIAIENLQLKGKEIGRLDLVGHPEGSDWRLRRLNITNPDGSLVGDGIWRTAPDNTNTQINLTLQISDAGKILARSGYPDTVKRGSGKLVASLAWAGSPNDFSYNNLDGTLKLDTGNGQFLKMDPGAGKLLSVLSLQALPKRITLDFTDVFSSGFQFDNINGNATIKHGVIDSQDFHIDGSSAKVTMKGSVDLNRGTQDLRVRVLPTLGDSVSLLGAFAAGPVVGIGSLIVNKMLGNPLDKLVSFEYNVSGAWSDPVVVKVGQAQPNQNEDNSSK